HPVRADPHRLDGDLPPARRPPAKGGGLRPVPAARVPAGPPLHEAPPARRGVPGRGVPAPLRTGRRRAAAPRAVPRGPAPGHPDRQAARLTLGAGAEAVAVYLKREHRVPWPVRLANALAGFGFVSRSLREARTLQALGREAIAAPEWLAAGEDGRGRAFLLV